jgi:GNAT superfamily N-acetyltransferase
LLFTLEPDNAFDADKARRGLGMLLAQPDAAALWVAEETGRVIGMCSAQITLSTVEGGPVAWIEDVIVQPSSRGRGVGRQLLEAVAHWASQRGLTRLQLLADRYNVPALAFYQHLAWRETRLMCLRHSTAAGS